MKIPSGETRTYAWVAGKIGNPKATRAVAQALHRNPWPLIIPCHRIVASDGDIGGYAYGKELKKVLLSLEKALCIVLFLLLLPSFADADTLTLFGNKKIDGNAVAIDKNSVTFAASEGAEKKYKMMQVEKLEFAAIKKAEVRLKGNRKLSGTPAYLSHGVLVLKSDSGPDQRIFMQNVEGIKLVADMAVISKGGADVDLALLLEPGRINIIDFYAEWCGPCKAIAPKLEELAKSDPDVVLRKIDIVNWGTPVCEKYGIRSVPNIRVFDRKGKQVGSPTSSIEEVRKLVEQAKK